MSYTRPTGGNHSSTVNITGSGDMPWTYATGVELLDLTGDPTYPPVKADGVYAVSAHVQTLGTVEDAKNFRAQLNIAPDTTGMFVASSGKTVADVNFPLNLSMSAVVELNAGDVLEMSIATDAAGAVTVEFDAILVKLA